MIKKSDDQTKGSNAEQYEGFCVDLLKEMSRILGFRYELRLVRDGSYGSRNSRGHWNGMVRELIDRNLLVHPKKLSASDHSIVQKTCHIHRYYFFEECLLF
ncbi:glutamate receptor ionotropic, kainate 2 [Trichonephila inaurata madagascariensis]|uniref:Glutamate receptor ionotropic, kainate 2 n=1 Tax=Trichonephila inaurata madagascariensis TaxID=2747483 RepID=A0A8X6XMW6_9ARAC|nr:glutamate receptor ionotropic, kainate 2 [Trichonephila inaurata madagascariensis]